MKIGKTFYAANRRTWRSWLVAHYKKENEVWLIYYKKSTGKPRIPYNDAVEEALCFGWIDSTAKAIDDERFAQRFTPRRRGSRLSQMNKERIRKLILEKRMTAAGLAAVSHVFNADSPDDFSIATDILDAIRTDENVWKNFQLFPERYKRIRIGYIESQRSHSHEAFQKSLTNFIKKTAKNKKFGLIRD
ncbi:Bacteriocin-protection, YdeI or OmpD-Associated [Candidatus Bilamarchaeum dharawalense]|uniref:Bacteriocin-protection, YdeI or OmpD-Associated n=1 Tax=Candidatus Bilamarchaeum dharawalense TaxID=2885759 RepID=A0A5E4LS97_9ARCH|nr:Bacteriocin-protection, YdeI or OmpD-Associated [Candidatus Bilamarchaeum dharawalense]